MKKLFVSLIVAAMLAIPFVGVAMAEDAPILHRAMWFLTNRQVKDIANWVIDNGSLNWFLAMFTGVFQVNATTPEGNLISFIYISAIDEAYLVFEDSDGVALYEKFGDGNLEVDEVHLHDRDANICTVLYEEGDDVPSIYSTILLKNLSRLYINHIHQFNSN